MIPNRVFRIPKRRKKKKKKTIHKITTIAQLVKNPPAMQERSRFHSWVRKMPCRRDRLPTPVFLGFPGGSVGKESACNAGDLGLIPGLGRSPRVGNGNPLQYSCLGNFICRRAWQATVHGVTKSRILTHTHTYTQQTNALSILGHFFPYSFKV